MRESAAGRSIGSSTATLQRFFAWMCRQNLLHANPAADLELPKKRPRNLPKALTLDEVNRLLNLPDVSDPLGVRDRAMLELFYAMNTDKFWEEAPRLYRLSMEYPKAPSAPALLFKAALMSPQEPIDGKAMMAQLTNEYPRSRYAAQARYALIYRFVSWKEHETRVAMTEAFIQDYPSETQLTENLKKHDQRVRRLLKVGFDAY